MEWVVPRSLRSEPFKGLAGSFKRLPGTQLTNSQFKVFWFQKERENMNEKVPSFILETVCDQNLKTFAGMMNDIISRAFMVVRNALKERFHSEFLNEESYPGVERIYSLTSMVHSWTSSLENEIPESLYSEANSFLENYNQEKSFAVNKVEALFALAYCLAEAIATGSTEFWRVSETLEHFV